MIDICIIGGGAAGMTAAICAKEANPPLDVLLLEKKNQLGKKLLATGNGKCNLSNQACDGCGETLDFFGRLGLLTRTDSAGRIYPYTEEARAVQGALAAGCSSWTSGWTPAARSYRWRRTETPSTFGWPTGS